MLLGDWWRVPCAVFEDLERLFRVYSDSVVCEVIAEPRITMSFPKAPVRRFNEDVSK